MDANNNQDETGDETGDQTPQPETTVIIAGQPTPISHVADMAGIDIDNPPTGDMR